MREKRIQKSHMEGACDFLLLVIACRVKEKKTISVKVLQTKYEGHGLGCFA